MASPNQHVSPFAAPPSPSSPPPTFQPFFTLIAPTPSNPSHSHPHVHYIFADDAKDPTLDLPPPVPGNRVITLDIDAELRITRAHSLARDFQLVAAELKEAPSMDGGEKGLMLVLEGVEAGRGGAKGGVVELGRVFEER